MGEEMVRTDRRLDVLTRTLTFRTAPRFTSSRVDRPQASPFRDLVIPLLAESIEHRIRSRPRRSLELSAPQPGPRMLRVPDGGRAVARPVLGG